MRSGKGLHKPNLVAPLVKLVAPFDAMLVN